MITRLLVDKQFYGGKFSRIYWFSPSATVDDGLDPLREYVKKIQDQEEDPTFHDDFDPEFIRKLLDRQKKITELFKRRGSKKRFNIAIVVDDHADNPSAMHRAGGILETLYVRARHFGVSTIVFSQKLKLMSPTVRVNLTALLIFVCEVTMTSWTGSFVNILLWWTQKRCWPCIERLWRDPLVFSISTSLPRA